MERDERSPAAISRRRLLGTFGAGLGAVALTPACAMAKNSVTTAAGTAAASGPAPAQQLVGTNMFGRIFPELPPFAEPSEALYAALMDMGRPGGVLDAGDDLTRSAKDLIVDPGLSANNPNNPDHTAGTTFMGQFMDHDITFDASSTLFKPTVPEQTRNFRNSAFDLDSVYGSGFVSDQLLYNPADRVKLRIESGGRFEDLPRDDNATAIIADPRNDENLVIAGLHCTFILFHNHMVDRVRANGVSARDDVFAQARQLTLWHYHWLIVHEFLPQFVGGDMVNDVLTRGRRFYRPDLASVPVEFQGAAYRFGHSMVRPSYRANLAGDHGKPFFGLVFDPAQDGVADPADLRGGARAPRRFVGWQTFFDFGDGEVKPNKRIDTKISTPLLGLPLGAIASHDGPTALPQRNLLRHVTWALPSGQRIARRMGVEPLTSNDLPELAPYGIGLERHTPLWYYVLKEAELAADGRHLGPVGGRIVAEVILGLLQLDTGSYLNSQPKWRPTLPSRYGTGEFHMVDLLTLAGVDPASRGE
jgi:Animal haem peroxidase